MNAQPIISVSGLRGIVGESLTPDVAIRYTCAFADQIKDGPIVVTRDGRATGPMIADIIRGSLCAVGRNVIDGGVAATPTTGVLVRQAQAAGGIQISASHNPRQYNGMKLFGPDGRVITEAAGQPVLAAYQADQPIGWVGHDYLGHVEACEDTLSQHLSLVLATVDVSTIRARRFRVLLDANHGAGGLLGRLLLEELGCQVTLLGTPADGLFEHAPEPTSENLAGICQRIGRGDVDVGFCQDPDADRLALIDETGRYVGEEYTLALTVSHVLSQTLGPIVTNCSTSRMSKDIAAQFGVTCYDSKVGEANVTSLMIEKHAVFGGEGNGGPIDPRVGYVRDSFVGMALVLDSLAQTGKSLSLLAAQLPQYAIHKAKVPVQADELEAALDRLAGHFADAEVSRLDGLRLDWKDRWLLVRASNTEPIVRLIAEANQPDQARQLCETAASLMDSIRS